VAFWFCSDTFLSGGILFSSIFTIRKNLRQCDQIGRIFAHRVIVITEQFLGTRKVARILGHSFPQLRIIFVQKYGLGYILVDFFYKLIWPP
jgi:hypothetical protein